MSEKKQHVDLHRKLLLRRQLLEKATASGAIYIPFCGDGDIALELYAKLGRKIYAADIDRARVKVFRSRFPNADVKVADCDGPFPFGGTKETFAIADFDAWSYPYHAFRAFWQEAKKASPLVVFFTDGIRQAITRAGSATLPDGSKFESANLAERRKAFNFYWAKVVKPWFVSYISPWRMVAEAHYVRGRSMLYWGAVLEAPQEGQADELPSLPGSHDAGGVAPKAKRRYVHLTAERKEKFVQLISEGVGRIAAARAIGVNISTVERHMHKDPAFAEAVRRAETEADEKVENALFQAAISGNVSAIELWLTRRLPDKWGEQKRVVVSGPSGGPIEVRHGHQADVLATFILNDPEGAELAGRLLELMAKRVKPDDTTTPPS